MNTILRPYIVYAGDPDDGAVLAFAHTVREARLIGYREILFWNAESYIDVNANLIRNQDWLFEDADPEKLKNNEPHINPNPRSCKKCECWGGSPIREDGICQDCYEEAEYQRTKGERV